MDLTSFYGVKYNRPISFWEKISIVKFYSLDHPETLTLALHGRYLIYYHTTILGIENGGWIKINNVLDIIDIKVLKMFIL